MFECVQASLKYIYYYMFIKIFLELDAFNYATVSVKSFMRLI